MNGVFHKTAVLFCLCIFVSGCATPVNSQIPVSVFQSSETHGRIDEGTNLFGEGGYRADVLAEVIPDVTAEPIITDRVKMNAGGDLFGALKVSLHDRIDAGGTIVTSGLPVRVFGKWMFYGEPSLQAKKGDFSMAVLAELSLNTGHHWTDQDSDYFSGKIYSSGVTETKTSSLVGLLSGYRGSDRLLFYSGIYFISATNEGVIEPSINGQRQKDVKFDFKATGYSIPIGVEFFFNRSSLRAEVDYCSIHSSQNARYSAWALNLGAAF